MSVVWRNEPILQLDVEVASTVRQLKTLIASATGIPEDEQLLIYAEHVLRNDLLTLEAVGLKAGHVIYFVAPWWRPSDAPDAAPDQFDLAKSFRALGDVPKGMLVGLDISGDAPLIAPSPSRALDSVRPPGNAIAFGVRTRPMRLSKRHCQRQLQISTCAPRPPDTRARTRCRRWSAIAIARVMSCYEGAMSSCLACWGAMEPEGTRTTAGRKRNQPSRALRGPG